MARPKNSTENMTPQELRAIADDIGFTLAMLARALAIPYRTLQDYALGVAGIPAATAARIRDYQADWKEYWSFRQRRLQAEIDREFPNGIRS